MKANARFTVVVAFAAALALLSGCQNSASIAGKVIQGDVSFIGVVDAGDERLKAPGLQGAEIAATTDPRGGAGPAVLGKSTSGPQGDFGLRMNQSTLTGSTGFTARRDGFAPASGVMPMPSEDRRLLVILKPLSPAADPRGR